MILRSFLLVFLCAPQPAWAQTPSDSEELTIQRDAFLKTLEQPLRTFLMKKGYTPRNAARATSSLLDRYAQCLAESPHPDPDSETEVMSFWLGNAAVSAYKSPCLTEFLNEVAGMP